RLLSARPAVRPCPGTPSSTARSRRPRARVYFAGLMKRIERKHLKENELERTLAAARDYIEPRRRAVQMVALLLGVFVVALVGFGMWRLRAQAESERALAEAMVALNAPVVPAGV